MRAAGSVQSTVALVHVERLMARCCNSAAVFTIGSKAGTPDLPEVTLLVLIDDATGRILLRFNQGETTQGVFELLKKPAAAGTRYGIPKSIYTDYGSVYWTEGGTTQYERAMKDLGVEVIFAKSPQAKGRKTFKGSLSSELTGLSRIGSPRSCER